jgi:ferredoxin
MIYYFTGTGNSLYAARRIASVTGDGIVSVNEALRHGGSGSYRSQRPYVFVCPTYAWRMPRVMERFILDSTFEGHTDAYFVLTCGDETGNAARYAEKLCDAKGWRFMGLGGVVMPENYIALFDVPQKAEADAIIKAAEPRILEIAEHIKAGEALPAEKLTFLGRFYSTVVNPLFYPFAVSAKGFHVTDACTGCGRCASLCPLSNVRLDENRRPVWGRQCTHCMACIAACPVIAVEYKKNSRGKPRHYLPDTPQR